MYYLLLELTLMLRIAHSAMLKLQGASLFLKEGKALKVLLHVQNKTSFF